MITEVLIISLAFVLSVGICAGCWVYIQSERMKQEGMNYREQIRIESRKGNDWMSTLSPVIVQLLSTPQGQELAGRLLEGVTQKKV